MVALGFKLRNFKLVIDHKFFSFIIFAVKSFTSLS